MVWKNVIIYMNTLSGILTSLCPERNMYNELFFNFPANVICSTTSMRADGGKLKNSISEQYSFNSNPISVPYIKCMVN